VENDNDTKKSIPHKLESLDCPILTTSPPGAYDNPLIEHKKPPTLPSSNLS